MDIVGNFIFHSNHCDANEYSSNFVKALISTAAAVPRGDSQFTSKRTSL